MTDILLFAVLGLQAVVLLAIFVLWRRHKTNDITPLQTSYDGLQKGQERLESVVREEMAVNRREASEQARAGRDETGASMDKLAEQFLVLQRENTNFRERLAQQLGTNFNAFAKGLVAEIERLGAASNSEAAQLRAELTRYLSEATANQGHSFEGFEQRLAALSERNAAQMHSLDDAIMESLEALQRGTDQNWEVKRLADAETTRQARLELHEALANLTDAVGKNFLSAGEIQRGQFDSFVSRMDAIAAGADNRAEVLRGVVDNRLQLLQEDNAHKLEAMRQTVDEKLQGTLNERLGESFKAVSDRLELVHAGLGEMQTLANGVGDLKNVLTNAKTRGNWGEMQLGNLLEQMLTPQQYAADVAPVPGSEHRVEFAVRLPGQEENQQVVWLPIDAKFPQQNYLRLLEAHETGGKDDIEAAGAQLEVQIKASAREICDKYILTPHTTDFAIMFLPTEGLYAEVMRRDGLVNSLHQDYRITLAGPTTLASILNALQMGFRTLAIQKRSTEVWGTLAQVKTEFGKYGDVLDAVQKKLHEASQKIDDTRTHSRAIERKLRDVEASNENDDAILPLLDAGILEDAKFDDVAQF